MPDSAPPSPVTTSWITTVLRQQVISVVTSGTTPTAVEGRVIYETDTDRLRMYDGTGWIILDEPWQTWSSPSWTNLTLGNGTYTHQRYKRSGGNIDIELRLVFGSTTSISGSVSLAPPVNAGATNDLDGILCWFGDASATASVNGTIFGVSTSSMTLFTHTVPASGSTAYPLTAVLSSTVPFTWTTSDTITIKGRYRMTTRYS